MHCVRASPSIRTGYSNHNSHAVTFFRSGSPRDAADIGESFAPRIRRRTQALWSRVPAPALLIVKLLVSAFLPGSLLSFVLWLWPKLVFGAAVPRPCTVLAFRLLPRALLEGNSSPFPAGIIRGQVHTGDPQLRRLRTRAYAS